MKLTYTLISLVLIFFLFVGCEEPEQTQQHKENIVNSLKSPEIIGILEDGRVVKRYQVELWLNSDVKDRIYVVGTTNTTISNNDSTKWHNVTVETQ